MSRGLADTSIFIARESGRRMRLEDLPDELGVSVVTIGELRAGVLAATNTDDRDRRLGTLTAALALDPHPIDVRVAEVWGKLRVMLKDSGQRMPVNDSWIAATAMAMDVPIVTQDDDYVRVLGLEVVLV